jgi:hypothetical protein
MKKIKTPNPKKAVRWADQVSDRPATGKPTGRILHPAAPDPFDTSPFTVTFSLGGDTYVAHVPATKSDVTFLHKFETSLSRMITENHRAMFRLAISRGYVLRFRRLLRSSTTMIEMGDFGEREAAFKRFQNAVFNGANVSLEWL